MSLRFRTRSDGSTYTQVRFRIHGKETSVSFNDHAEAMQFDDLIAKVGPAKAVEITRIVIAHDRALTVGQWLTHHNEHLTGVEPETLNRYKSYAKNDFALIEDIPLAALTDEDVARWMNGLRNRDGTTPSGKTVANKHGYLAGALNAAVERGHVKSNPCDRVKLPRWDREEMCFLEPAEYQMVRAAVSEYWRPLVDFLVASGARWSEATALTPADVDRGAGTVRITRAWKTGGGGYRLGVPKTKKSVRTINVDRGILDQLDYTGRWLFTNSGRGRAGSDGVVRIHSFNPNVWKPALERAHQAGLTKTPRVHDLRHTCASWLIAAGRPLPAVQQHLGHESIMTTVGVYGHLDRSSGQGNADALAAFLR
jgi:integrase